MVVVPNADRFLRSGELSRATGLSTDTLRHYEKLGILAKPPRSEGGYRLYPPESLDRVQLVQNALASGFKLKDLVEILRVRDAGGAPCDRVVEIANEKVRQLDFQIAQLTRLRDSLTATLTEWNRRLKQQQRNGRAFLLESLHHKRNLQKEKANEDTNGHRIDGNFISRLRSERND